MATTHHIRLAAAALALAAALVPARALLHSHPLPEPAVAAAEHESEGEELDGDEVGLMGDAGHPRDSKRPQVTAFFPRESYAPGDSATLVVTDTARNVSVQIFRTGGESVETIPADVMLGTPVGPSRPVGDACGRRTVSLRLGNWPSGVYYARLSTAGGRVGFAPFVLRPSRLGVHRIAVVMPTQTWQAYNFRDDNGDGRPDTWYFGGRNARLGRAFLNRGVPPHWKQYDAPFVRWLAHTGRSVDYLSDAELRAVASGDKLARAYSLIVFSGHHEYVTEHEYDVVQRYRDLGGNLMFLAANNFFWKIDLHGTLMTRVAEWRDLGRPEASLIGVQYRANDRGGHRGPWILSDAAVKTGLFAGLHPAAGNAFGRGGIEIDQTAPSSPKQLVVLGEIPDLFGPGFTAQMTYYETATGAKVFAAGAFSLAGWIWRPDAAQLVSNLWTRLGEPDQPTPLRVRTLAVHTETDDDKAAPGGRPGVAAYFTRRSYAPGETARLVVEDGTRLASIRIMRSGPERSNRAANDVLYGVPMTPARAPAGRSGGTTVRIGDWPSGLYFAGLRGANGLVGYAPFVVRPRTLGEHRVAVVLPTNTWQAYNFRDEGNDGVPDSWYADPHRDHVDLERAFLNRGVPPHFRGYDLGFLRWLARTGKQPDVLSDDDFDAIASGARLARLYDLVIFSGHEEYVTPHMVDLVERYRSLGGNLAFLAANNFFYRVERRGHELYRTGRWRDLGRAEVRFIGVQYLDWNENKWPNRPFVVTGAKRAPWLFAGTGLENGDSFGSYGIEIDARTAQSPPGVKVLARIPDAFGPGRSAEMTYYRTARGAKVFAAGAMNFGGSALWPLTSKLLENIWRELSAP